MDSYLIKNSRPRLNKNKVSPRLNEKQGLTGQAGQAPVKFASLHIFDLASQPI
jgi:hypothetical protein